jgi:hypothetical protein
MEYTSTSSVKSRSTCITRALIYPYSVSFAERPTSPWRMAKAGIGTMDPYLNAQGLGLIGAGHGASVIIGKDHQVAAFQPRVEDALATTVVVVAVDKRIHRIGLGRHAHS